MKAKTFSEELERAFLRIGHCLEQAYYGKRADFKTAFNPFDTVDETDPAVDQIKWYITYLLLELVHDVAVSVPDEDMRPVLHTALMRGRSFVSECTAQMDVLDSRMDFWSAVDSDLYRRKLYEFRCWEAAATLNMGPITVTLSSYIRLYGKVFYEADHVRYIASTPYDAAYALANRLTLLWRYMKAGIAPGDQVIYLMRDLRASHTDSWLPDIGKVQHVFDAPTPDNPMVKLKDAIYPHTNLRRIVEVIT